MNGFNTPKGGTTNASSVGKGKMGGDSKSISCAGYKHGGHVKTVGSSSKTKMVTHTPVETTLKKGGKVSKKKHK